jgi:hypothetical protein
MLLNEVEVKHVHFHQLETVRPEGLHIRRLEDGPLDQVQWDNVEILLQGDYMLLQTIRTGYNVQ